MNDFCVDLEFNWSLFVEEYDIYSPPIGHSLLDTKYISKEFFECIDSINLKLQYIEIFVKTPYEKPGIHTDDGTVDMAKINWIFNGNNSLMAWYKVKPNVQPKPYISTINSYSEVYTDDMVELIHTQRVGNPSIVRVGIPHSVYTLNTTRYCYSVVVRDKSNNSNLTFNELCERFKQYIK